MSEYISFYVNCLKHDKVANRLTYTQSQIMLTTNWQGELSDTPTRAQNIVRGIWRPTQCTHPRFPLVHDVSERRVQKTPIKDKKKLRAKIKAQYENNACKVMYVLLLCYFVGE